MPVRDASSQGLAVQQEILRRYDLMDQYGLTRLASAEDRQRFISGWLETLGQRGEPMAELSLTGYRQESFVSDVLATPWLSGSPVYAHALSEPGDLTEIPGTG